MELCCLESSHVSARIGSNVCNIIIDKFVLIIISVVNLYLNVPRETNPNQENVSQHNVGIYHTLLSVPYLTPPLSKRYHGQNVNQKSWILETLEVIYKESTEIKTEFSSQITNYESLPFPTPCDEGFKIFVCHQATRYLPALLFFTKNDQTRMVVKDMEQMSKIISNKVSGTCNVNYLSCEKLTNNSWDGNGNLQTYKNSHSQFK